MRDGTDNDLKAFAAADNQFGRDSSGSSTIEVPELREGQSVNLPEIAGDTNGHTSFDPHYYLKVSDNFRETIKNGVSMYDDELDVLSSVLEGILAREAIRKDPMPFSIIVFSRLENLLKSLVDYPATGLQALQPNFKKVV